jgi:signal transduction histidine kinase
MKILLLIALFCTTILANTLSIDSSFNDALFAGKNSVVYRDTNDSYTIENISSIQDKFQKTDKTMFGYTKDTIYSHFTLQNTTDKVQKLYISNPLAILRYIDVLVKKEDSQKIHHLGVLRDTNLKEVPHRLSTFLLILEANETVDIYIKHKSTSSIDINWKITNAKKFLQDNALDNLIYGLLFGVILAFLVYAFTLYRTFRESSYIYYALFGLGILIVQFSLHGVLNTFSFGLSAEATIALSSVFSSFYCLMLILFMIHFFNLKVNAPFVYKFLSTLVVVALFMLIASMPRLFDLNPLISIKIQNILLLFYYISFVVVGFIIAKKRLLGGVYFFIGIGLFVTIYFIGLSYIIGIISLSIDISYLVLFAVIADMSFISLAISQKVYNLKREQEHTQKLLLEHAKFKNIGIAVAEVIHQIKTPIAQLGAISSNIAMIFEIKKDKFNDNEHKTVYQLENSIQFIKETIDKLYNFYKTDENFVEVDVDILIEDTKALLNLNVQQNIDIRYAKTHVRLQTEPATLKNILLVILNNSVEALTFRNIKNPTIVIESSQIGAHVQICISDNAGGIKEKNIDDIFTMFESSKKEGLGIGLALAKKLTQEKLQGELLVENIKDGVKFYIELHNK